MFVSGGEKLVVKFYRFTAISEAIRPAQFCFSRSCFSVIDLETTNNGGRISARANLKRIRGIQDAAFSKL